MESNARTGGRFEILLVEESATNDWWAMVRPGKRARVGTQITMQDRKGNPTGIVADVIETNDEGNRRLRFSGTPDIGTSSNSSEKLPCRPYIHRDSRTAGGPGTIPDGVCRKGRLGGRAHGRDAFTTELLEQIRGRGVQACFVTLHVGPGTFLPVKTESLAAHKMHEERFDVGKETARIINEAKSSGRRVIAVGTTTVRVLESMAALNNAKIVENKGKTRIFIHPPYRFRIVNALLTNFHLPCSTLLMLVSAFAAPGETHGREWVLAAYAEAIRERYRFFSYGDAMLIL